MSDSDNNDKSDKSDKRSRGKMEESDAESCSSGFSVKSNKKTKIADNNVVNLLHKKGDECKNPGNKNNKNKSSMLTDTTPTEAEIDTELAELKETLNKIKETSSELKKLFAEGPLSSRPSGKLLSNTLDQQLAKAFKSQRSIELLRIVKNLTYRESATQVTPTKAVTENPTERIKKTLVKKKNKQTSENNINKDSKNRASAIPKVGRQGEWTEVDRKKREEEKRIDAAKRKQELEATRFREKLDRDKKRREEAIPKTEAIIIKATEGNTYASILKNLKEKAGNSLVGIQTVRRSRGGDVILELEKNTDLGETEVKIRNSMGTNQVIRKATPRTKIEIGNIDPTVDKPELLDAIAENCQIAPAEVIIKSLRTTFRGNSRAIIEIPTEAASCIIEKNRIRLGYTVCTIKRAADITRCFRCHEFGHLSYNCREATQGTEFCRRCGKKGHAIKDCQAESRCRLCIKKGLTEDQVKHVAGALSCPQLKKHILERKSSMAAFSI